MVRTSDGRRSDRRHRLVREAERLFRANGTTGTGVSAVCEAAGTTKGVFSHHFPGGKHELIAEVITTNATDVDRLLDAALAAGDPATGVCAVFDSYAELLEADAHFGCPLAAAVVDESADHPDVQRLLGASFQRWEQRLSEAIGPEAEATVATAIVSAFEGAILLARAQRRPEILRDTGYQVSRLVS